MKATFSIAETIELLKFAFSHPEPLFMRLALLAATSRHEQIGNVVQVAASGLSLSQHSLAYAFQCLGRSFPGDAVTSLLSHEDVEVRLAAATALGAVGTSAEIPALEHATSDPDERVRAAATSTLERVKKLSLIPVARYDAKAQPDDCIVAALILQKLSQHALTDVGRLLRHPHKAVRQLACTALVNANRPDLVLSALDDYGGSPTKEMLHLLGEAHLPELVNVLRAHWSAVEPEWHTLEAAFNALADLASVSAICLLVERITSHPELAWGEEQRIRSAFASYARAALHAKGLDFIDPGPLESPTIAPPPEELATRHFGDWTLGYAEPCTR